MLVDDIKKQVTLAMKSGDTVARDVLRLALGEIQTAEARKSAAAAAAASASPSSPDAAEKDSTITDEEAAAIVRKLIKSNEETLALAGADSPNAPALRREVEILSAFLPKSLSVDDIVAALASEREALKAAKSDGQATGIAMKHLKTTGASVSGNDVGAAVKKIRG